MRKFSVIKIMLKSLFNRVHMTDLYQRIHVKLTSLMIASSRELTAGERILAQSIFGAALDFASIRLCSSRFVVKNYALSPNGSVYFNPKNFSEDFSQCSLNVQSWLIHELVHVWQIQQGVKIVRCALFDRRYRYVLRDGKSFFQYGIEQQAQMVQDYFLKRERGEECCHLKACLPF
jgi:hypothetical protein